MRGKKKFCRKVISYVLALAMVISVFTGIVPGVSRTVHAEETLFYTLDGLEKYQNSNYATAATVTQDEIEWSVMGNLTQNGGWRIGGKNLSDTDREIYSESKLEAEISKVELELGEIYCMCNSIKLIVASDEDFFSEIYSETIDSGLGENSTLTFTPKSGAWEDAYYKFVFNVTCGGSSNKYVQFKSANFYIGDSSPVQTTYSVTVTAGENMTKTAESGDASQTGLTGAMTDVVYTADEGYYFPTDYSVEAVNGITVTRNSYDQITVSGTPTADAAITLTAPVLDDCTLVYDQQYKNGDVINFGEKGRTINFGGNVFTLKGEETITFSNAEYQDKLQTILSVTPGLYSGDTVALTTIPLGILYDVDEFYLVFHPAGEEAGVDITYGWPYPNNVIYDANDATGGSVPEDSKNYIYGNTVTVSGNTGNLVKTGCDFAGWNTKADGNGVNYAAGETFTVSDETFEEADGRGVATLYAKWVVDPNKITIYIKELQKDTYTLSVNKAEIISDVKALIRETVEAYASYTDDEMLLIFAGNSLDDTKTLEDYNIQKEATIHLVLRLHNHNDIIFRKWASTDSLPAEAGNYYLAEDVTLSDTWTVPEGTTNLCLNGHKIKRDSSLEDTVRFSMVTINSGATLKLYDEDNTGSITGGIALSGGGVYINAGNFEMYGGSIADNNSYSMGGGIFITSMGSFTMNGGRISGNAVTGGTRGGGVSVYNGTFILNEGEISQNEAYAGGGVAVSRGSFTMNGGIIKGNTVASSAGMPCNGGGVVTDAFGNGSFNMTGGIISGNYATGNGGGVFVQTRFFTMSGGSIVNNNADVIGGGICGSNDFGLSGNVTVKDNVVGGTLEGEVYTGGSINNVFMTNNRKINLVGALDDASVIGVSMNTPGVFTSSTDSVLAKDYKEKFFSDNVLLLVDESENELQMSCTPVTYLDENGESRTCTEYIPVNATTTSWNVDQGWYVVNGAVTFSDRIYISKKNSTVNLILCDGATLNADSGINSLASYNNTLNIFAQSTGEDMGKLNAAGSYDYAGIGSTSRTACGTINIYGGDITAVGGKGAAGIGGGSGNTSYDGGAGGTIGIYGGKVTATAGEEVENVGRGAAIGAGSKSDDHGTVTLGNNILVKAGDDKANAVNVTKSFSISHAQKWAQAVYDTRSPEEIAIDTVSELPSADAVTLDDKEAIEEARAAYDALTDEQKAELDDSVLEKLEACEDAFTTIVSDAILIIDEISEEKIEDIRELLDFYDELSDAEKDNVDEKLGREGKKKLSDVESVINAVDKIEDIPLIEEIDVSDEKAIKLARTVYGLLSNSQKALLSDETLAKLEAAEAKLEELKEEANLEAAKDAAKERLSDYARAKALSDLTTEEIIKYDAAILAGCEVIDDAEKVDDIALCLGVAKDIVDTALAEIKQARADAEAAAKEMAEADEAIADALVYADVSKADAAEAAADKYASGADKQDIATAMATLEGAINAAKQLAADASAADKNAAAQAVMDAAAALDQVVDAAKVRSAAAKAADEAAAAAAAQLDAAKDSAIDRLNDYSEAKALADATDTEKEAYNKAVTDGKTAIEAATTIEAVAAELANAKAAVDAALAKIAEDRAAAAAAAQEMAEADEAVADALVYADVSKADAVEAAADEYASNADKQDIATAIATLEGAINAAKQLAADASAEAKREAAKAVMDAAAALDQVVDAAKVRSAAAKAAATELAAARASACERLDDYSEAKALADATDAEKEAYNKAVTDGKTAINAAATTEAVAEALKAAKAAVDAALAKIAEDRAAAAEAAAEMEEADESLELARTIAGLAMAEAEKAANDEYASDTDKNAITTAKATLEGAINAAAQLAADASAAAKRAAAQTIVNAANALYDVCETAERNSAAAKADAEAAAAAAAALAAAREYACERLDDFTDAKALDDATEAEQKEYDDVIAAEKEKINAAADQAAIDEALKAAKAAVNAELAKIKDDRTKAAAVVEMISGLPATEEIVLDDKEAVEAARTAYDALTDDQKLKVSDEVVKTLEDAEDMVVIRQVKSEIIARTGMIYNGQAFQLIDTPETDLPDGFTMMYAVTTENVEPDALEYAEDIPEAVEFGNYYVWFKVVDKQDNIWGGVSSVEVTIIRPTEIVTQPAAAKVIRGSNAKFSVEATGDNLTYVWQISKDGVNWSNSTASGCDTDKITFRATKALNGRYYRCVITGAGGVVISDAVKLTTLAVINGQPGDAAATIGSDATFSVSSRSSAATYQWQVSTDGGETWKKSSAEGCDTDHLTVNVKSAKYGEYLFRCKVTNGTWVEYSKAAGIDIVTFIVKQPETIFASEGDKVKLYVKAKGIAPTYQWEVMTSSGKWVNSTAPGNDTNILTFKATAVKTAYKWRCKITDGDTVLYSDVVTLVIESGQYED